jgi:Cof subfamily protein (haloacid dehalogenase superfamily)
MELLVFDLDGTLLNKASAISDFTSETLRLLSERDIAYTIATGRTLHGARSVIEGHRFDLPQAYKNGVMIWHPRQQRYSSRAMLTPDELDNVVRACQAVGLTPFVFTLDDNNASSVYFSPARTDIEQRLVDSFGMDLKGNMHPLEELPSDAPITHVNAIGDGSAVESVFRRVGHEPHLVAYSGIALEGEQWRWLDIHHSDASKGGAIKTMKELLGLERVICFGDSDNDLSMFEAADECYAPLNANEEIKAAATAVIGHHDEEGIARFLRERFDLDGG